MIIKLWKHKQKSLQSKSRKGSPCTEKVHPRIWWQKLEQKGDGGEERDQAMEKTPRPHDSHPKTSSSSYENTNKNVCNLSIE
jgi:hypothetical protein